MRPDFTIFIERNSANSEQCSDRKLLAFKGEEKALSNHGKLKDAKNELVNKISNKNIKETSVYFPLLFCYAAAGKNVQFFVINRNNHNELNEISAILDLTNREQRMTIINIVTNMAFIIVNWCKILYEHI